MQIQQKLADINDDLIQRKSEQNLPLRKVYFMILIDQMIKNQDQTYENNKPFFLHEFKRNSSFCNLSLSNFKAYKQFLVLQQRVLNARISFHLELFYSTNQFIGQSNQRMIDQIGNHIQEEYDNYDGFVVWHPKEQLISNACILSFGFENLNKPIVILEQKQSPHSIINESLHDIKQALMIAGYFKIPEVTIFEDNKLMRAVRVKRDLQNKLISANYPTLMDVDKLQFNPKWKFIYPHQLRPKKLTYSQTRNDQVMLIKSQPFFGYEDQMEIIEKLHLKVLIFQCYGSGTFAKNVEGFQQFIDYIEQKDLVGLQITQSLMGQVKNLYDNSISSDILINLKDMNEEATIIKAKYLLAKCSDKDNSFDQELFKKRIVLNLRGEIKEKQKKSFSNNLKQFYFNFLNPLCQDKNEFFDLFIKKDIILSCFQKGDKEQFVSLLNANIFTPKEVFVQSKEQNNILHFLAQNQNKEIIDLVAKCLQKEDIEKLCNQQNTKGNLPLIYGSKYQNKYFISKFQEFTKDKSLLNEKNKQYLTDFVFQNLNTQSYDRIRLLYYSGFTQFNDLVTSNNLNIGHLAVLKQNEWALNFLQKDVKEFDFNKKDNFGKKPFDYNKILEQLTIKYKNNHQKSIIKLVQKQIQIQDQNNMIQIFYICNSREYH